MVQYVRNSLDDFGARYLDPMLGMWISVDPAGQFASPYLYAGNGVNPINGVDDDGNSKIVDHSDER
jgi:RHS repeat-associated protein